MNIKNTKNPNKATVCNGLKFVCVNPIKRLRIIIPNIIKIIILALCFILSLPKDF